VKNFQFLFAAWMSVWVAFFVYEISVSRRIGHLKDEIQRLNQHLGEADIVPPTKSGTLKQV
jgi:hypothetical protein